MKGLLPGREIKMVGVQRSSYGGSLRKKVWEGLFQKLIFEHTSTRSEETSCTNFWEKTVPPGKNHKCKSPKELFMGIDRIDHEGE